MDLFCGCGGLTLGVSEAARHCNRQLDIRLALDQSPEALSVYKANFQLSASRALKEDADVVFDGGLGKPLTTSEEFWKRHSKIVDLIVAGPPCQGHSDLNNVTRRKDPRNRLYLRVVRAAEVLGPKVVIIENVPAVLLDKEDVVTRAANDWRRLAIGSLPANILGTLWSSPNAKASFSCGCIARRLRYLRT